MINSRLIQWNLFFLCLVISFFGNAQTNTNKAKRVYSQDKSTNRFLINYFKQLSKNYPDSAYSLWRVNDSLVRKLDSKIQKSYLQELGNNYIKNKKYDAGLSIYNLVFNFKNEIKSSSEVPVVLNLIRIYSSSCATDSLEKYLKILDAYYKKIRKNDLTILSYYSELYYFKGDFDSAHFYIKKFKKNNKGILTTKLSLLSTLMLYKTGNYKAALLEVQKDIELATQMNDLTSIVKSKIVEVSILNDLGQERKAFEKSAHLYSTYINNSLLNNEVRGLLLYTHAQQYYNLGKFNKAIDLNTEAINLLKNYTINCNLAHGKALLLSAQLYTDLTDYGAAELYLNEASNIFSQSPGSNNTEYDEFTFCKTFYFYSMEKYSNGLNNAFQTLTIRKKIYGINTIKTALAYTIIGNIFEKTGSIEKSRSYLDSALNVFHEFILDKNHSLYGQLFNDIGLVEQRKELVASAIESYGESLRIFEANYGVLHPDLSVGFMNIASLYLDTKEFKKAFYYVQKSLMSNCIKFNDTSIFVNPKENIALSDFILLRTSILKSRLLTAYSDSLNQLQQKEEALNYYKAAIENYLFCLRIIHRLRNSYVSEDSKVYLTEKTSFIFEEGIQLCRSVYSKTKDIRYLDKAFSFSEKSKAGMLLSAIQESNAKKIANLPDSILNKEKSLIATINKLDNDLFNELKKGRRADFEKIENYKKSLFENKQELIAHLKFIEVNYNKYYKLKYDDNILSINDVQTYLLKDEKNILVEYFVGKDSIYIFFIAKDKFEIFTTGRNEMFSKSLIGLRNSIQMQISDGFVFCSMNLYDYLVKPISSLIYKKNVIIVPDVLFSGTPIQVLIDSKKRERNNRLASKELYKKLPYVLKNCPITYEISASVALQNINKEDSLQNFEKKESNKLIIMAPVFDEKKSYGKILESSSELLPKLELDTLNLNENSGKYNIVNLPGTEQEALKLIQLYKNKHAPARAYMYNYAQRELIKTSVLQNYTYIHFATHGELDLSDSRMSGLQFVNKGNEYMNDVYNLGNVYSLDLRAKLISLSACETGLGKVVSGEGLMGFTRAFTYAGAQSIVVSLWKVSDNATTELMINFYQNLFNSKTSGIAINKAQLKLLKNKSYQPPYYWASFILYGN